jgi:hypothetical protein
MESQNRQEDKLIAKLVQKTLLTNLKFVLQSQQVDKVDLVKNFHFRKSVKPLGLYLF